MERGSDKHSPRLDEQLKHETEALVRSGMEPRAEEWKQAEPSGEDEPPVTLSAGGPTPVGGTPDGLDESEVEERSELARWLPRSAFPAVREVLIDAAIKGRAPERVVTWVKDLPAGREFANVGDAWSALGGGREQRP